MKKKSPAAKARTIFPRKLLFSLVLVFVALGFTTAGTIWNLGEGARASAAPKPTPPKKAPVIQLSASPDNLANIDRGISSEAAQQIAALVREKRARTHAQKKIDSRLLYKIKKDRNDAILAEVPALETDLKVDNRGYVAVDIRANVTPGLIKYLKSIDTEIINSFPQYHSIAVFVRLNDIETIAGMPDVDFIIPVDEPQFSGVNAVPGQAQHFFQPLDLGYDSPNLSPGFELRARNVTRFLSYTVNNLALSGSTTSEGDSTHRANLARSLSGADGSGLKIGVLSNGVASLASRQSSGDLPPVVTVLSGQAGSGDEGTAMLEIVYDIAPGAQLYFATANPTSAQFAQNIKDLRTAGCDIIIDDVSYFYETPFQNGQAASITSPTNGGIVVQAVNDVTVGPQAGALYFSSAANSGNKNDGTAGAWEGDFVDGGAGAGPLAGVGQLHNFGGSTFDTLTANGRIVLKWSDPLGASANDYDLYILNSAGTAVVAAGTGPQSGTQDPLEDAGNRSAGERIVIAKFSGANRFLHLNTNRGQLSISTPGVIYGHNGSLNTISVAATPARGPFPEIFSSSNVVETFSSDGPRRIFYNADSTPITPGNVSSSGGQVLQKPDITAADGVTTTTPGFIPFFGTSAAAPHAGALAALLKSASPGSTNAQIYAAMINGAIDIEAAGADRDSGAGIFMPLRSMNLLGVGGSALLDLPPSLTASESLGNGNGQVDPGEHANLALQLNNLGLSNATGISATLTTSTPGVTISGSNVRSYPDIASAFGSATSATPFFFTLATTFPCAASINFTLTVTYSGGSSPQTFNFSVPTGSPTSVSTTLDITAPSTGATYAAVTGSQSGRLARDGNASSCSSAKASPGLFTPAGSRLYDAYTFTASGSGCTTVTLNTGAGNLFVAAYNASGYVPSNPNTNYLADAGVSGPSTQFSFNVSAGQQYTVVVHEVDPAGGDGSNYSLQVAGPINGGCQILIPTAATAKVSGKVLTGAGKGIHKAVVTITDMSGGTQSARTNAFGAYSFKGVKVGQSFVIRATASGYQFGPQFITVQGDVTDLNFVAQ